jgi:acetyltransferase-like isoleucine patch superfamily enzyme
MILSKLGPIVQRIRYFWLVLKGYKNINSRAIIERKVNFDKVYPESIHIDEGTLVASFVTILTHEHIYRDESNPSLPLHRPVHIGKRCFIGISAIILPGIKIGDDCIIGSGSVVTKDVPNGSMAVGVPARIIRSGIVMSPRATLENNSV